MDLVLSYLVIVLSEIWHKGTLLEVGTPLEVTRAERSAMLPATARDATDEEIAKYRGGAAQGGIDASSALSAVQAELSSLEAQSKTLEGEVHALGVTKGQLAEEVGQLQSSKQELTGEIEALEQGKEELATEIEGLEQGKVKLVEEVAELEKAKKAAAKATK